MNIAAHIAVAAATGRDDPAELLGSALPDLAAMGRFRLRPGPPPDRDPGPVARGIRLHHRTDEAFHAHRWFLDRQRSLIDDLTGAGFARGPALACGHVGIELLLDGALLEGGSLDPEVVSGAFDVIPRIGDDLGDLVEPGHRAGWLAHLDRFTDRSPVQDLDDPRAVAERLHRILLRRPRLAFGADRIPRLAAALARQRPTVAATGEALVDDLAAALSPAG